MIRFLILCILGTLVLIHVPLQSTDNHLFELERMVVASGVEDREPVGISESFTADVGRVYSFVEAHNIQQNTKISFVWYFEGELISTVELDLQEGQRWRTFSYITVRNRIGQWRVDLQDEHGTVVQSINFIIE